MNNNTRSARHEPRATRKTVMPFFSIIVPVYNVAQYLKECLDSVLAQTYPNWECLCVNDGSTDDSGAILNEYAQRDARFRVFHKKNGGVSSARNLGLDCAIGEWILFLDSDDLLAKRCLNVITRHLTPDIDWFSFNAQTMNAEGAALEDCRSQKVWTISREDFFNYPIDENVVWGNCFRRAWLNQFNLRFNTALCVAEDSLFISLTLLYAQKMRHAGNLVGYFYRLPEGRGSLMERATENYWDCRMICLATLLQLNRTDDAIWHRLCEEWIHRIYSFTILSPTTIWQQYQRLQTNRHVRRVDVKGLQLSRRGRFDLWYWMMPQTGWLALGPWVLLHWTILLRLRLMRKWLRRR